MTLEEVIDNMLFYTETTIYNLEELQIENFKYRSTL